MSTGAAVREFVFPAPSAVRTAEEADRGLVERFQAGEEAVFEAIFRRYQDSIFGLCLTVLGDREKAEDAAQETFLRAYANLNKVRCPGRLGHWLRKIAVNVCRAEMKAAARERAQAVGEDMERIAAGTPGAGAGRDSLRDAWVQQVLASLKPEFRLVLVLRDVQGLSYEEIVEVTGCSMALVKVRLHRARKAFAARFLAD